MALGFREKKPSLDSMRGAQYFEPDMELLKKHIPNHELCKRKHLKPEKHQAEALWALLDVVPKDEIVLNRRAYAKNKAKKQLGAITEESATLTAKMEKAETLVELEAIFTRIKEIIDPLPKEAKVVMMKLVDSIYGKMKDQLDPEKVAAKKVEEDKLKTIEALKGLNLAELKQPVLKGFAKKLNIETDNYKAETVRPLLVQYLANLPKEDTIDGKVKIEFKARIENTLLKSDIQKLNQKGLADYARDLELDVPDYEAVTLRPILFAYQEKLRAELNNPANVKASKPADGTQDKTNELVEENEELKEVLENKEEEVSDLENEKENLEEENDELQQQNEILEGELEQQKKSKPAAVNAKSGKSTQILSGENSK